jgi:predicted SprT family Zn-dependent metalloprotease
VGPDEIERQKRLSLVYDALTRLNSIDDVNILLKIVAASRNFQLMFDFNREHVNFIDPKCEGYATGQFEINGRICIGAFHLLSPNRAHEVLGVIAHEFCHFAMFKVFQNMAKPFQSTDQERKEEFERILESCKEVKDRENIVKLVFDYDEEQQAAELIVRVPHALAHYIDQPEGFEKFEENFQDLTTFYTEKCLPILREKLPQIEQESERRKRKEYAKPTNFIKFYWKEIILTIILVPLSLLSTTLLATSCVFKLCGSDSRASCHFYYENFYSECECTENFNWHEGNCYICSFDNECLEGQVCFDHHCYEKEDVFTCADNSSKMFSLHRCDGIKDCNDASDEMYHCGKKLLL